MTSRPSSPGAVASLRRLLTGRLMGNAIALMISSGGTSVLGVVFWGLAAHLATATVVGRTTAEIAAMMLLSNLAQLSFQSIFERFLPVAGVRTRAFVQRAYVMCVSVALVLTTAYVVAGFGVGYLPVAWWGRVLFVLAVGTWTVFVLQDSVLVGMRASKFVPVENLLFAVAKLALLPLLLRASSTQGIFLAWTLPVVVAIAVVTWYIFSIRIPAHASATRASEELPGPRELFVLAGAQYATMVFTVFTPSLVSLIVIQRLGAVANAHYYIPSLFLVGLMLVTWSVARSFLVEAAHEPDHLRHHANTAIRGMALVVVPAVAVGVLLAPELLRAFGREYADTGVTLLRMLLLSLPLYAINFLYSSFAWYDRRVWRMAVANVATAGVYLAVVLATIGRLGINAIGVASLVASGLEGAYFLPQLVRRYRSLD